ncbi:thioesterase domain-containing protein [uncultured Shewanella sp.]|uniref:thioesterase domain-containing protein n=1 Tax=Shewanella atlantica TaxID=271099 RepID=UPI00260F8D1E|nr:thioesterase domain-containing protein [uncultured Shewanella sp.]
MDDFAGGEQVVESLLKELAETWHRTIPVSAFMQISPLEYSDKWLTIGAPLPPNINLHQTMFAGSIYTLATLTGWGMLWLQQRIAGVDGDIVLADGHIRYLAPITEAPLARCCWPDTELGRLSMGRRVKVSLEVELWCEDKLCATFEGLYVSQPIA